MERTNVRQVIMVVDDCADSRDLLKAVLSLNGYLILVASDGREAVEISTRACPDLILMDLSMPILDGYHAVQVLREIAETRHVPIIACSAHNSSQHRTKALAAGFNAYLTKPIDLDQLDKLVVRFVNSAADSPQSP